MTKTAEDVANEEAGEMASGVLGFKMLKVESVKGEIYGQRVIYMTFLWDK